MPATAIRAFDHATGQLVTIDSRSYCDERAALQPDPRGNIVATYGIANGRVHADYYERVNTFANGGETTTQGAPIAADQAQMRIAVQRAAVKAYCDHDRHIRGRTARPIPQCAGGASGVIP